MVQVVLQPSASAVAQEHYAETIARPVVISHVANLLGAPMAAHLSNIFPTGAAPLWGVTPGANGSNIDKWNSVEVGALVLFAAHGRIFGIGNVAVKFRNAQLARKLWGNDESGQTWRRVELTILKIQMKRDNEPLILLYSTYANLSV